MDRSMLWTSSDLELLPNDGKRYEIIDGELYVSSPNHLRHQATCGEILLALQRWNDETEIGYAVFAPGLVFNQFEDVAPDVVWISNDRLAVGLDENGHLRIAPELIAEVLTPGEEDERRDRVVKLDLYSRRGIREYWIVSWQERWIEVYRQECSQLRFVNRFIESDTLESPLLPGFSCCVAALVEM